MIELVGKLSVLSFDDSEVTKMEKIDQKLCIRLNQAFMPGQPPQYLNSGILIFDNIQKITARIYDSSQNTHFFVDDPMSEPLEDICEASFTDFVSRLAGFSQTSGHWVEWIIVGHPKSAQFHPDSTADLSHNENLIKTFKQIIHDHYPDYNWILAKIKNDSLFNCAQLLCATFFEYENYVFIKEQFSSSRLKQAKLSNSSNIEWWMNIHLLDDFFESSEDAIAFIDLLAIVWDKRLRKQFPHRNFQVEKLKLEEDENCITFFQSD